MICCPGPTGPGGPTGPSGGPTGPAGPGGPTGPSGLGITGPTGPAFTGPAGGDLAGTYPNPTVVAVEETGGPTRLAFGAIAIGDTVERQGNFLVGVPSVASSCVTHLVQAPGLYSCAENDQTIASGYASLASGAPKTLSVGVFEKSRAGLALQAFTIAAGGLTVTIVGDVRDQFERLVPSVRITPSAPGALPTVSGIVNTTPAFAGGNTTFDLLAPIDLVTTGGTIVQSDEKEPSVVAGSVAAGGTLVTMPGDQTAFFVQNQFVTVHPTSPVFLQQTTRIIASPVVFGGVNTTFSLNAAIDTTTLGANFGNAFGRGFGGHAEGVGNIVESVGGHVEGVSNRVGEQAVGGHAEGIRTIALSPGSHTEGWCDPSFFNGLGPIAYYYGAHAEGEHTIAGGNDAHAEGVLTFAAGFASHAENTDGFASGDFSHVEGGGCTTGYPVRTFSIAPGTVGVTIVGVNATAEFVNGQRVTLFPYTPVPKVVDVALVASVPVFAAGNTTFNLAVKIDDTTTGGYCVDTSFGQRAHAEGFGTQATGAYSHTGGISSKTLLAATAGFAHGNGAIASAAGAISIGNACTASGVDSFCIGIGTTASGQGAFCCGFGNTVSGIGAFGSGQGQVVSGDLAFASGRGNTVSAEDASAFGEGHYALAKWGTARGLAGYSREIGDFVWANGSLGYSAGDAQYRFKMFRGTTPGLLPGETVRLLPSGLAATTLENSKRYKVSVEAVASQTGAGAVAPFTGCWDFVFVATVTNAGTVAFSAVSTRIAPIITGAGFVGATLLPSSVGANDFTLKLTIGGLLTVQSAIVAKVQFVELLDP